MPEAEELIERITEAHDAFNRGDFDAAVEIFHPDVHIVRIGAEPDLRGLQAVRQWMEPDAFESQSYEIRACEVVDNRVLVRMHVSGRGAGSGIEVEIDSINVWTFDESGRAVRIHAFFEHEEPLARQALEAG